jgi:lysophospholipase L1-like esterase
MFVRFAALALSVVLATPVQAQDIIAIGDSIMDWNGAHSVPAQLSRDLGRPVDDRYLAEARISTVVRDRMESLDIRAQLDGDRPDILAMTGGGNDLGEGCGCRAGCAEAAEPLLTEDGRPQHPISADALAPLVDRYQAGGKPLNTGMVFPVSIHN